MPRETHTRDDILRVAGRLVQTRGYNGFSYAHVAEALGVKPAAIHYHFRSKEDLGVAVARRFRDRWRALRATYAEAGPLARLEAVFDGYAKIAERGRACPAAVIHAELDAVPEGVAEAAREVVDELVGFLAAALAEGRAQGKLTFDGEPRSLALVLVSMMQGALQLARTQGVEVFHATRARVLEELFRRAPSPAAAPAEGD